MQSHDDYDSNSAWDQMRKAAERLTERGENLITAGAPHERPLSESTHGGFLIRHLPDDPLCLRISIGEAPEHRMGDSAYLVYRGNRHVIRELLRRALYALDAATD